MSAEFPDLTVPVRYLLGVTVADGWSDDTLESLVLLRLREAEDVVNWFGIYPDVADALAGELHAAAERARSKSLGEVPQVPDSLPEGWT